MLLALTIIDMTDSSEDMTIVSPTQAGNAKGIRFWMVITALMLCVFMAALELTAVSTALPSIIEHFGAATSVAVEYSWIGSSYALA